MVPQYPASVHVDVFSSCIITGSCFRSCGVRRLAMAPEVLAVSIPAYPIFAENNTHHYVCMTVDYVIM